MEAVTSDQDGAAELQAPGGIADPQPAAAGKARVRTCVGCGERTDVGAQPHPSAPALPLVRLILGPDGSIAVDPGDGGFGRGAHVHPRPDCLAKAVQRGLPRVTRGRAEAVHVEPEGTAPLRVEALARAVRQAVERRVEGLLRAATRTRAVAVGADAVSGACARGEAELVVVACDAAAGAELPEVRRAVAAGRAAAWGTKAALGSIAGGRREHGVALLAVTSGRIAAAAAEAIRIADACAAAERGAAERRPAKTRAAGRGPGAGPVTEGASDRRDSHSNDEGGSPGASSAAPGGSPAEVARGLAKPGSAVRDPVVDGAATKRRPRGWVRRIG